LGRNLRLATAAAFATVLLSTGAQAHGHRHHHHRHSHAHHAHAATTAPTETGGGMAVIRAATGATALVARDVAGKFQHLSRRSKRPARGLGIWAGSRPVALPAPALGQSHFRRTSLIDICQLERNVVGRGLSPLPAERDAHCREPRADARRGVEQRSRPRPHVLKCAARTPAAAAKPMRAGATTAAGRAVPLTRRRRMTGTW
jgi:hypothetical protein